jgi:flavin-dependent dehydrogenase
LLQKLAFSPEQLVDGKTATYKHQVNALSFGRILFEKDALPWIDKWPLCFEKRTYHVDRTHFDQKLFEMAQNLGVTFIWERISNVDRLGDRVMACQTATGQRITATWFIDASGRAKLFSKAFKIPKSEYGRQKVCLWTHFDSELQVEGTTFHVDNEMEYLSWIWEIPIRPHKLSIGYITPAEQLREQRKSGQSVREIFTEALLKHPRFTSLLAEEPEYELSTCSYRSDVNQYACGPNWFIVGEAASMADPLTSNGITAAFRHAEAATTLIQKAPKGLSRSQQQLYNTDILQMAHAFNRNIETALYDWPLRWVFGPSNAVRIYVIFGYLINALYSKFEPQSWLGVGLFQGLLITMRLWFSSFSLMARFVFRSRQLWHKASHSSF